MRRDSPAVDSSETDDHKQPCNRTDGRSSSMKTEDVQTLHLPSMKNMQMDSLTVSAHYSTGGDTEKGRDSTPVLGMGTVFVVLIFHFIHYFSSSDLYRLLEKKFSKKANVVPAAPAAAPIAAAPAVQQAADHDDGELAAVIAAAIAAAEGTSADGFIVRSIKRRKSK